MALFQNSVLKKYLASQSSQPIQEAFAVYQSYSHNPQIRENIRAAKEEQFQEGFLRELFVKILGYTINPMQYFERFDYEIDAMVYEFGFSKKIRRIEEGGEA